MADSQMTTHGGSYAYTQSHFPEFYDLWTKHLFGTTSSDEPVFNRYLLDSFNTPPDGNEVVIVDLGTGTGRLPRALLQAIQAPKLSPSKATIIVGVDHSDSMLRRAEVLTKPLLENLPSDNRTNVRWITASASSYASALRTNGINSVDLLFFSVGSIAHLTSPAELDAFLSDTARVLRPGTGRAVISILSEFFVPTGGTPPPREDELDDGVSLESVDMPDHIYEKGVTKATWDESGEIKTETFGLSLKHGEQIVWEERLSWSLKVIKEEEWMRALEGAELRVVEKQELGMQIMYVLRKA
jgi:SAM-dependent methyltransferase